MIFRSEGKNYLIKSTAFDSLGIAFRTATGERCHQGDPGCFGVAEFRSKGNMSPLGGGLSLRITLTDRGEPGGDDSIGIALWDGNQLLFSSEWNGSKTVEGPLGGGNLVVH